MTKIFCVLDKELEKMKLTWKQFSTGCITGTSHKCIEDYSFEMKAEIEFHISLASLAL